MMGDWAMSKLPASEAVAHELVDFRNKTQLGEEIINEGLTIPHTYFGPRGYFDHDRVPILLYLTNDTLRAHPAQFP